jgi:hypothetical protein
VGSPQDFLARRQAPDRRPSRRGLLGGAAVVTVAAAAGLLTEWTAHDRAAHDRAAHDRAAAHKETVSHKETAPGKETVSRNVTAARGRILFNEAFAGHSLSRKRWNPYICDSNSHGWPWLMQRSVAVPSSAIGRKNAAYDLPSAVRVDDGLTLRVRRGSRAAGYSWTGSVICSRPTRNNFGSGTVHTAGFTFADARVEVRAKMPDMTSGQWPAIWFLPVSNEDGAEIDLFEGGFLDKAIKPDQLMAVNLISEGNQQQHFVDCDTDLSAGYHTYSMEYRQGSSIKVFFDGSNVCTYTRNVPVGRYFIILSNSVASAQTAGWHTQVSNSTPTVNLMQVSNVRVMSL